MTVKYSLLYVDPPWSYGLHNFADVPVTTDERHVDRKFHEERMNGVRGRDDHRRAFG